MNKIISVILAALITASICLLPTHVAAFDSTNLQYAKVDLNKNGVKDVISIKNVSGTSILSINNQSIKLNPNGYPYCIGHFNIIDVKSSDKFKEIQIHFEEDGGYRSTAFYYYNGKSIIKMGYIIGSYKYSNRKGTVTIGKWCGFLEYYVEYKLNKQHTLQKVVKNIYSVNKKSRSFIPITLQKSPTYCKKVLTLKKDEKITIVGISFKKNKKGFNDNWLLIKNSKGKTGWVNVDQLTKDKNLDIDKIFEGLYYAG